MCSSFQAKELTRALDIESVLCLADRTPLGRVEEVRIRDWVTHLYLGPAHDVELLHLWTGALRS